MPREPAVYRPMTKAEQKLSRALVRCSLPPASFTKRFARDVAFQAESAEPRITEKQLAMLQKMVRKFRRQIRTSSIDPIDHFLLDPKIPLPEAPLSLVRSDVKDSRSAPEPAPVAAEPDQVEGLPGCNQLSFAEVASG